MDNCSNLKFKDKFDAHINSKNSYLLKPNNLFFFFLFFLLLNKKGDLQCGFIDPTLREGNV